MRKIELPVFPSDHFGLVLTITKQGADSFWTVVTVVMLHLLDVMLFWVVF
jgi:hypothetical protein